MQYADRIEAGVALAEELRAYTKDKPLVEGLPRGGVVVAAEVARALGCDLDVIVAGKLRAPSNPELAFGAITEDGAVYINEPIVSMLHIDQTYIEEEKKDRIEALKRKLSAYRSIKPMIPMNNRVVILVDDGIATGSTMISAIHAAVASGAARIIVAVPGGPRETIDAISRSERVDAVICPLVPEPFFAVSQLYVNFRQTEDSEVERILKEFA